MTLCSFVLSHSERVQRAAKNAPPFRRGETSKGVAFLQAGLIKAGHPMPVSSAKGGVPDGNFGAETYQVVREFQSRHKLRVDGVAGTMTITRLDELLAKNNPKCPPNPPRTTIPGATLPSATSPTAPAPTPFVPPQNPDFKVGVDDPPPSHDAGAGPWNSKPKEIGTRVLHTAMKQRDFQSAAMVFIGYDAVRHLNHYNNNSGAPLDINLAGMINDVPSARKLYETIVANLKVYMEEFPEGSWSITSKRKWGGYNLKSESTNWYFAVGGYSAWIKGRVTISGSDKDRKYIFDGQYKFYDRYNWDGGKQVTIAGIVITDQAMGEFHRQGLSREYDEIGSCAVRFSWRHGSAIPPGELRPLPSR